MSDLPALAELARLAKAATPGSWTVTHKGHVHTPSHDCVAVTDLRIPPFGIEYDQQCANAEFIAACSPDAILALVALATGGAADVPTGLIHEADGLLSLVAHRYRVYDIPRDLCDELIACSNRLRRIGEARKSAARSLTPERPANASQ